MGEEGGPLSACPFLLPRRKQAQNGPQPPSHTFSESLGLEDRKCDCCLNFASPTLLRTPAMKAQPTVLILTNLSHYREESRLPTRRLKQCSVNTHYTHHSEPAHDPSLNLTAIRAADCQISLIYGDVRRVTGPSSDILAASFRAPSPAVCNSTRITWGARKLGGSYLPCSETFQ